MASGQTGIAASLPLGVGFLQLEFDKFELNFLEYLSIGTD